MKVLRGKLRGATSGYQDYAVELTFDARLRPAVRIPARGDVPVLGARAGGRRRHFVLEMPDDIEPVGSIRIAVFDAGGVRLHQETREALPSGNQTLRLDVQPSDPFELDEHPDPFVDAPAVFTGHLIERSGRATLAGRQVMLFGTRELTPGGSDGSDRERAGHRAGGAHRLLLDAVPAGVPDVGASRRVGQRRSLRHGDRARRRAQAPVGGARPRGHSGGRPGAAETGPAARSGAGRSRQRTGSLHDGSGGGPMREAEHAEPHARGVPVLHHRPHHRSLHPRAAPGRAAAPAQGRARSRGPARPRLQVDRCHASARPHRGSARQAAAVDRLRSERRRGRQQLAKLPGSGERDQDPRVGHAADLARRARQRARRSRRFHADPADGRRAAVGVQLPPGRHRLRPAAAARTARDDGRQPGRLGRPAAFGAGRDDRARPHPAVPPELEGRRLFDGRPGLQPAARPLPEEGDRHRRLGSPRVGDPLREPGLRRAARRAPGARPRHQRDRQVGADRERARRLELERLGGGRRLRPGHSDRRRASSASAAAAARAAPHPRRGRTARAP